jgi:hypothetical protein
MLAGAGTCAGTMGLAESRQQPDRHRGGTMSASHGNTPAAWTAVSIMFVGFLISGFALPLAMPWLFFVGLVVVVLGAVVGKVMSMMGMGSAVTYKDDRDPEYQDHSSQD